MDHLVHPLIIAQEANDLLRVLWQISRLYEARVSDWRRTLSLYQVVVDSKDAWLGLVLTQGSYHSWQECFLACGPLPFSTSAMTHVLHPCRKHSPSTYCVLCPRPDYMKTTAREDTDSAFKLKAANLWKAFCRVSYGLGILSWFCKSWWKQICLQISPVSCSWLSYEKPVWSWLLWKGQLRVAYRCLTEAVLCKALCQSAGGYENWLKHRTVSFSMSEQCCLQPSNVIVMVIINKHT